MFPDSSQFRSPAIKISVVVPCLDEAETIGACVAAALRGIEAAAVPGEVIVADNGSTDGFPELAVAAGARVVSVPHRGYGDAAAAGVRNSQGQIIIMGDADGTHDLSCLVLFVEELERGNDLVIGNRFDRACSQTSMRWINRFSGIPP